MEAGEGLSEHCGLTAEMHFLETRIWLTELMELASSGNTTDDNLELCDKNFVFRQLLSPHGQVEQGFLASAWKTAKVGTDNCQCTLAQATKQINLSANKQTISQPMEQDIPKEAPKGTLCGLQEWDKGVVCTKMLTPPTSATPVAPVSLEETLCIKQWSKTKSLTLSRLSKFFQEE